MGDVVRYILFTIGHGLFWSAFQFIEIVLFNWPSGRMHCPRCLGCALSSHFWISGILASVVNDGWHGLSSEVYY